MKHYLRYILAIPLIFFACQENNAPNKEDLNKINSTSQNIINSFPFYDTNLSTEERVLDLISRLTLEEKIDQMMNGTPAVSRLGIPAYDYWNEALHGVGRTCAATIFPQAIGLGATFDKDLAYKVSTVISDEARAIYNATSEKGYYNQYNGLTFWSPNVNIFRDPRWGRGQETFGEDPFLTSLIGVSFVKGLQGDNPKYLKTAACAKHFAVHSGPEKVRHEFNAVVNQKDLWETYLPVFRALVNAKVESVMCAYNQTNGEACCSNNYLINNVLRNKWGFKGHVLTDCSALVDYYKQVNEGGHGVVKTKVEAAALAVKSGVSLNCGNTYTALNDAIKEGLISEKEIDEQLEILLKTRFKLGLFDPNGSNPFDDISIDIINNESHRALSKEVAQKSFVLLKNNGILPLKNNLSKYFVTGPNAASIEILLGNYYGVNSNMVSILEGISSAIEPTSQLQYRLGAMLNKPSINPINYATGHAGNSDVTIVVLGVSSQLEGEEGDSLDSSTAGDKLDYNLPENQINYLRELRKRADRNSEDKKPIVAVITGGSPINLTEVQELADAVLFVWYPGEEGGNAVADVLFGKVSPSGRLPITFPKSLDQLPAYEDYSMKGRTYKYMNKEPLYPFGYGLSYANFEYTNIKSNKLKLSKEENIMISVDVNNISNINADEVVQLYISDVEASVNTPNYQLIGVKRITLKEKESKEVNFELTSKAFEIVNNQGKKIIESGEFKIYIGGSSPMDRSNQLGMPKMQELSVFVN